ncbi:MAG: hypothetical protein ABR609_05535 [Acidimicrobiia bacterium]
MADVLGSVGGQSRSTTQGVSDVQMGVASADMAPNDTNGTIRAVQSRSTFRRRCAVSAEIRSTPEKVWALLTQTARMVDWNPP